MLFLSFKVVVVAKIHFWIYAGGCIEIGAVRPLKALEPGISGVDRNRGVRNVFDAARKHLGCLAMKSAMKSRPGGDRQNGPVGLRSIDFGVGMVAPNPPWNPPGGGM
jgi:hypothetical protein